MPQPTPKPAQIAIQRTSAPPVYRPTVGISQPKLSSVPTAGQRPPAPPVWRPPVPAAQGKLGAFAAMNRQPAQTRSEAQQPLRNPVVQRMEYLEEPEVDEHFWIPRQHYRPNAPTLGDWLTPALAPYQRRERQIARSRAGMVRAQERLEQNAKRYNFHDLTAARPVLDSLTAPRPPLGAPVWAAAVAARPLVVAAPVAVAHVAPPAAAAAPVAAPAGTPAQRFAAMCNGYFLNKHTATSKEKAQAKALNYSGTVTVIKINATNATILENTRQTPKPVVWVTGWKFVNGKFKGSGDLKVGVFRGVGGFDHLDFTT